MDVREKLVVLIQNYLQEATELHNYNSLGDMDISTPCGFSATDPVHMYFTPETYGSVAKLFDTGSSHAEYSLQVKAYFEYATIGGVPIRILWTTDEYKEVCKNG